VSDTVQPNHSIYVTGGANRAMCAPPVGEMLNFLSSVALSLYLCETTASVFIPHSEAAIEVFAKVIQLKNNQKN
jgi:hypothetical protein